MQENEQRSMAAKPRSACATKPIGQVRAGASACRGDDGRALAHLNAAVTACDEADMRLHAAAARVRLGQLLGGDSGRAEIQRGTDFMVSEGVRAPERMTEMLAPGFRGG